MGERLQSDLQITKASEADLRTSKTDTTNVNKINISKAALMLSQRFVLVKNLLESWERWSRYRNIEE